MASRHGELGLLTIGAIFLVVFGLIQGGAQFMRGELLPEDTTNETEDRLRAAVWNELDERRVANGLDPMPRDRFVRGIAQDTTDKLVADESTNWTRIVDRSTREQPLPNTRLYCTQLPVRVPRTNGSSLNETAVAVADALASADRVGLLFRPTSRYHAAMGIAIDDGAVYAVYRSCEQADT